MRFDWSFGWLFLCAGMKDVNWIVICIPVQLRSSLVIISLFGWTGRLVVLQKKKKKKQERRRSPTKKKCCRVPRFLEGERKKRIDVDLRKFTFPFTLSTTNVVYLYHNTHCLCRQGGPPTKKPRSPRSLSTHQNRTNNPLRRINFSLTKATGQRTGTHVQNQRRKPPRIFGASESTDKWQKISRFSDLFSPVSMNTTHAFEYYVYRHKWMRFRITFVVRVKRL